MDYLLEMLALVSLMVSLLLTVFNYADLPDEIPVHYNFIGEADRFGNKQQIWILPVVSFILYLGLTVLNRFPHKFNYPVEIRPDNAEYQYTLATRLVRILKLLIIFLFNLILYTVIYDVRYLSSLWSFFAIGLIFILIIVYLIRAAERG